MMQAHKKIVVVPDAGAEAGAVVWWMLSGDTSYKALERAWDDHGLPRFLLRNPTKEATALNRAVKSIAEPRRLVRPAKKKGEWVVVDEQAFDEGLDHEDVAYARLVDGVPEVKTHPHLDPYVASSLRARVSAQFDYYLGSFTSTDMSGLLCKAALYLDGLTLRDHGGMYFVPAPRMGEWRAIVAAIREATGHKVYELPSMRSEEAVRAVLDALASEAGELASEVEGVLVDEKLGPRGLGNREAALRAMVGKVRSYEELLGTSADALRERLQALEAQVAAAIFAANAETAEEEAA